MAIQNRYEFMYYVACTNCNPNGDPDMGNMPRIDLQTMQGFITDGATKRRIRNYVELAHQDEPGMNIIIQQATNINRHIAEAKRAAGVEDCAKAKEAVYAGRKKACELFYDVRTFGAVMSLSLIHISLSAFLKPCSLTARLSAESSTISQTALWSLTKPRACPQA